MHRGCKATHSSVVSQQLYHLFSLFLLSNLPIVSREVKSWTARSSFTYIFIRPVIAVLFSILAKNSRKAVTIIMDD